MTHPADHVYRFNTLSQWAQGVSTGLVFGSQGDGVFETPSQITAHPVARVANGETITALAIDPAGRTLWLTASGILWMMAEPGPVQIADLPDALARDARRLLWGQHIGWLVTGDELVRLDSHTGNRLGSFAEAGWRIVDAVHNHCDGVIVVETRERDGGIHTRLRDIRPEGHARVIMDLVDVGRVVAAARFASDSPIHIFTQKDGGHIIEIENNELTATHSYRHDSTLQHSRRVTMIAPRQAVMLAPNTSIFRMAFGLREPAQAIDALPKNIDLIDILWANDTLYVATAGKVYALRTSQADISPRTAIYSGPVLHSPVGDRSGWLRADMAADVPDGAHVILRHRTFETVEQANTYRDALQDDPDGTIVQDGWDDDTASTHTGSGDHAPLRHYLGQVTQAYIALRIEMFVPACAPPLKLQRMSVYYPNRSLIEELPAIYRNDGASERQMRRMLAPFQALADEIDDLIGDSVRRVDPETADDLWAGFLLQWLGHEDFARLDPTPRRALLKALPEILRLRGTLAGLARVFDILAPQGYCIQDDGLMPDVWVLPVARDPVGARLGHETRPATQASRVLTLGGCLPLGEAVLKRACFDPNTLTWRCHGSVTVTIFGGDAAEQALAPFTDRILRTFIPAHTHVSFQYGATPPADQLQRARSFGSNDDPSSLLTLNPNTSRTLSEWRLPALGTIVRDDPATLNSAVLDGTMILH